MSLVINDTLHASRPRSRMGILYCWRPDALFWRNSHANGSGFDRIRSRRYKRTVEDNDTFTFNVIGFVYDIEIR